MQDRVIHAVEPPTFPLPSDGALLRGLLGAVTGTGLLIRIPHSTAYWNAVPSSRCTSWIVVPERKPLFFCFSVSSCFFPSIYEPQGGLLQGASARVSIVVGLEFLHLHAADIGDNKVLNGGKVGFVGFGCPLVFTALLEAIHENSAVTETEVKIPTHDSCSVLFSVYLPHLFFVENSLPFVTCLAVLIFIKCIGRCKGCRASQPAYAACLPPYQAAHLSKLSFGYRMLHAYPQDTEFSGAVAQVVSRAQADGGIHVRIFHLYTSFVVAGLSVGDLTALVE